MLFYTIFVVSSAVAFGSESIQHTKCAGFDPVSCFKRELADRLANLNERLKNSVTAVGLTAIDSINHKVSYTAVFDQYELKNRPFKATFDLHAEEKSVFTLLEEDYDGFYGRMYPLSEVVNKVELGGLSVPKFAFNNYLLSGKHIEATATESSYFTQWPAVMPLSATHRSSSAFQCPANMHLLAWPYTLPGAQLSARLFHISSSAAYFESALFSPEQPQQQANLTATPFSGYYNRYLRNGFPSASAEGAAQLPPFVESELFNNEYLFVPNDYLVSFQCKNAQSVTDDVESTQCAVMALCIVDASNLNLFRDALLLNGKVAELEASVHAALAAQSFDPQMHKNPSDMFLRDYWSPQVRDSVPVDSTSSGTASAELKRDRRRRGSADFKDWQDSSKWKMLITSLTIPAPPAAEVLDVGRDWVSLSWNSPFVPPQSDKTSFGFRIVACKMQGGQLRTEVFALPFSSTAMDTDCESSKVMRGADTAGGLAEELDTALLRRTGADTILFKAVLRSLQPDTSYQLRLVVNYDQWESPPSPYSAPFRTVPQSVPSPPLPRHAGTAGAPTSSSSEGDPSILATTRSVTGPHGKRTVGQLEFTWPADDGGTPIIGFHVYGRAVPFIGDRVRGREEAWSEQAAADAPWLWLGAFPGQRTENTGVVELYNVPPLSSYQFKVAAYNTLGSSALSAASNVMHYNLEGHHVLHGWGHSHYFGPLTPSYLLDHAPLLSVTEAKSHHGLIALQMATNNFTAVCSDSDDLLVIEANREVMYNSCVHGHAPLPAEVFEVWRSHWTADSVSVHAKAVLVDQEVLRELPSGVPVQDRRLQGKIVFSVRGAIPFVEKAKRVESAGGLALVVVDDGQCAQYDQRCLPGADKPLGEGFGAQDVQAHWEQVSIPVFFVLKDCAVRWGKLNFEPQLQPFSTSSDEL